MNLARKAPSPQVGCTIEVWFLDSEGSEQVAVTHTSVSLDRLAETAEQHRLALERLYASLGCELLSASVLVEGGEPLELEAPPAAGRVRPRLSLVGKAIALALVAVVSCLEPDPPGMALADGDESLQLVAHA